MKIFLALFALLASTANATKFLVEMNCNTTVFDGCTTYDIDHIIQNIKRCIPQDMLKHGYQITYDVNTEYVRRVHDQYCRDTSKDAYIGKCCKQDCSLLAEDEQDDCLDYCETFNDPEGKRALRGPDDAGLDFIVQTQYQRNLVLPLFEECQIWLEFIQEKGEPLPDTCIQGLHSCAYSLRTETGADGCDAPADSHECCDANGNWVDGCGTCVCADFDDEGRSNCQDACGGGVCAFETGGESPRCIQDPNA